MKKILNFLRNWIQFIIYAIVLIFIVYNCFQRQHDTIAVLLAIGIGLLLGVVVEQIAGIAEKLLNINRNKQYEYRILYIDKEDELKAVTLETPLKSIIDIERIFGYKMIVNIIKVREFYK